MEYHLEQIAGVFQLNMIFISRTVDLKKEIGYLIA